MDVKTGLNTTQIPEIAEMLMCNVSKRLF